MMGRLQLTAFVIGLRRVRRIGLRQVRMKGWMSLEKVIGCFGLKTQAGLEVQEFVLVEYFQAFSQVIDFKEKMFVEKVSS